MYTCKLNNIIYFLTFNILSIEVIHVELSQHDTDNAELQL